MAFPDVRSRDRIVVAGARVAHDGAAKALDPRRARTKHAGMRSLTSADFLPARYPVALQPDEIQLWWFPRLPAATRPPDLRWRDLLAAYTGSTPEDLALARGEHGKPFLTQPPALEFNLSHSRGALLVGISREQALGVDIEVPARARPVLDLAERFFAADEAGVLARLDPMRQQSAFLQLWSCKEAVLKALGSGIGFGLDRAAFTLDIRGEPQRLNVIDATAGSVAEWQIVRLTLADDCTGAMAWRGPDRPLRAFALAGS
jgi:4'-phosphopantetheinyl transferase